MDGTPPSAYFYTLGGTQAAAVALQLGMNDWDALEQKPGRVAVLDELFLRFTFDITEGGTAARYLTYETIANECTAVNFSTRTGREILTALDGEWLSLMHILSRRNLVDVIVEISAQDTGTHKVPIWAGTFAFDLEEYPLAVADAGAFQEQRGGATLTGSTINTLEQQPIARGRFLQQAPTRRREWFRVYGDDEVHLPRGRYHAIHILNPKGANANLYDLGLTVTGPDVAIQAVDGRDLQRAFMEDYAALRCTGVATVDNPHALMDSDVDFIENIIQPIYWGGPDSMVWESGINGPITIRTGAADPAMAVYALRCVE